MQNMDRTITEELNEKYRNLNKEVSKINLKGRKPEHIYERLPKIYASGSEAKEAKNHDDAYIFFKRWIACVDWLKGQHLNKEVIKKFFSNDKIEDVKKLLQEVSNSIKLECEIKPKGHQITDNIDLDLRLPETPNDEPQPKENDEITCADLFKILNQGIRSSEKRLLIIDVRKEEDYLESKIAFPENIIHIPAEKIQPNKSPDFYRYLLIDDNLALDRYTKRSAKDIDIIVLLDSNSSLDSMNIKSPINMFKKSLKECDKNIKYKRIAILKGGFEEWIKTYPAFVTDPVKKRLSPTPSTSDSSVSSFNASYNFLNFSQPHEEATSPILSGRHPAGPRVKDPSNPNSQVSSKNDKSSSSLYNHLLVPYQNVLDSSTMANGKYTYPLTPPPSHNNNPTAPPPPNGISDKQLLLSNNMKEAKVVLEKIKPEIDRSKKPILGGKPTMPTTNQLEKELNGTQYSILQYEKKLQNGVQDNWLKEQLETLRKKEQEIMAKLGRTKTTRSADGNSGKLYPELSLSSMTLEPRTRASRLSKLNLSEEKENIPKLPVKDKIEPMIVDPQPSLTPAHMEVDEEATIRKEPLKSENVSINPGLKRSHSSPNLVLQNGPKSIPAVNRSLKPSLVPENVSRTRVPSAISWKGREQRLEAVFSSTKLHPGITGLKNLGNSCYMNSIIQCLSNTVYLAKYFNDNKYADHLNRNIDKARGYVAEEVAQVIKALWRGQYKSISPRDLKCVIGQYKMQFENFEQQDSHEFLMFLLDWMHNDLKQKTKVQYGRQLTVAETEWEKSMNGQSSVISELFFGQLRSTIECLYCDQTSTTYETFNSLTMSLPATNKCTLDECVKKFVSGQRVSGWKCPNCKVPRDGTKKFDIAKLPHIIVIHLNRFGETSGWLEKKNTAVDFPLANFNMRQYVAPDNDNFNNSQSYSYNLYAMSNHYGTMEGGHYTAYCKSNHQNKWYKYDDHTVSEVQANTVKNQSTSAYLLFYASASAENYLNS